jgi:hypothetical protein
MGLFDWGKKVQRVDTTPKNTWLEVDDNGQFYHYINKALRGNELRTFDNLHAYHFATHIAEIFTPLDIIADRVSSVEYQIVNKNTGVPIESIPVDLQRLIDNPNPISTFSQLVYDIVFSELASGGSYTLTKFTSNVKNKVYDRITNIWSLNPDYTKANLLKSIPDPFLIKSITELIKDYTTHFVVDVKLEPSEILFNNVSQLTKSLDPISPLNACHRNINNLIAVYSARYNVYQKNGVSGIVYKDQGESGSILEATDPVTRQKILDDLQERNGITGERNFTSVSSYKLGFIDTLGKIKDLQPFDETQADTIAIGLMYGVEKELLAQKESTTFTNKLDTEKQLWQNRIIPYCYEVAKTLTKAYYLPSDWIFAPKFDNVSILRVDDNMKAQTESLEIDNIIKLETIGVDTNNMKDKWTK